MNKLINITVKDFTSEDALHVGAVIRASMEPSLKTLSKDIQDEILDKHTNPKNILEKSKEIRYFVAWDKSLNQIVGVIGIIENEVRSFYVHPRYQGQGIGRLLINKLEEEARNMGLKKIKTKSSPVAEPIYKSLGFKILEYEWQEKDGNKFYNVWMEKELE